MLEANYTLCQFAPALGAFGLAAGLAGWLYEVRRYVPRIGTVPRHQLRPTLPS